MLDSEALRGMHPVVMTPSHDGKYFHNYVISLMNFSSAARELGMPLEVYLHRGESLITRARNNCVADFLSNPNWTHLFWIDSDIGFSVQAALRLLLSDYDVAAGVYPLKRDRWPQSSVGTEGLNAEEVFVRHAHYTVNAEANERGTIELEVLPDGFMKMQEAPTGFMVIKRNVFERMMKHYPELQYMPDSVGVADKGLHYRFFDVMVDPVTRRYLSEDYGFCRLWAGMGESIYIDANSNLSHQGAKLYRGSFADSLSNALSYAVNGTEGAPMTLRGLQYLQPNDVGAG